MLQSFEEVSSPSAVPERVAALRRDLKSRKLNGFLIPHSDEHQDEFLPPSAERLRWLTGFSETSTMFAAPALSRWLSRERRAMVRLI